MDEGLLSISSTTCGQLVKMPITQEPHGIFRSIFTYLFILTLSSQWWWGVAMHLFGRPRSFSENAHNSWTAPYILIKCCILLHFNIVETLVCKTVRLSLAGRCHMLITLESHGIVWSNFAYLYILTLSRHWYAKRWWGFAEHQSGYWKCS